MMERIKCCMSKDLKETIRTGKLMLFFLLSFGIAILILFFTLFFGNIPDGLTAELPGFDISSLEDMMTVLYPKLVKESCGVFAFYIGVFFSLITIIVTHGILPRESSEGRWVLPIQQKYQARDFIVSKCVVYGTTAGFSIFLSYMFYYMLANSFMEHNMTFGNAFVCAFIHGLSVFFIISYTMLLSVLFTTPIIASISMIGTVLFAPDILKHFSIGEYLPTFMLTFVYDSRNDYGMLVGPIVLNVFALAIVYYLTVIKVTKNAPGEW
ncbi:MAG: hypothetical protein IKS48_00875 [Eubacterium sp.]|nr:hypothetical protein [Eubacterium sp.]